jgi:hypothetical protein
MALQRLTATAHQQDTTFVDYDCAHADKRRLGKLALALLFFHAVSLSSFVGLPQRLARQARLEPLRSRYHQIETKGRENG